MRRFLLAGAMALAAIVGGSPAHAQFGGVVYDPSVYGQAVAQVQQLQQQYQTLQSQLQKAEQTYNSIAHAPDQAIQQVSQTFNSSQFRNMMPTASTITSMMNGQTLGSSAAQFLQNNRVYQSPGTDFRSQELNRSAQSIANNQAVAIDLYNSASARIAALQQLEGQLGSAPDAKAVADIQARIAQEQAMIQAQQVQAQAVGMMQQAQQRNEDQRYDEQRRKTIDQMIADAKAHGG